MTGGHMADGDEPGWRERERLEREHRTSKNVICPTCQSRPGATCVNVDWHRAQVMTYGEGWTVEQLALRVRRLEELVAKLRPADETKAGRACGHSFTDKDFTLFWRGSSLDLHANTHLYQCAVCGKEFDLPLNQASDKTNGGL